MKDDFKHNFLIETVKDQSQSILQYIESLLMTLRDLKPTERLEIEAERLQEIKGDLENCFATIHFILEEEENV